MRADIWFPSTGRCRTAPASRVTPIRTVASSEAIAHRVMRPPGRSARCRRPASITLGPGFRSGAVTRPPRAPPATAPFKPRRTSTPPSAPVPRAMPTPTAGTPPSRAARSTVPSATTSAASARRRSRSSSTSDPVSAGGKARGGALRGLSSQGPVGRRSGAMGDGPGDPPAAVRDLCRLPCDSPRNRARPAERRGRVRGVS